MIRFFKNVTSSLQAIAAALDTLNALLSEGIREASGVAGFEDRLGTLERELDKREAQAEATLERAQSKFASARAAEERARGFANAQKRPDNGDEGDDVDQEQLDAYLEAIQQGYDPTGPAEGVQPVPPGVGDRRSEKQALRARKLGRE